MRSADYAVAKCMSVCPSVTRRYSVETAKHIIKLFHNYSFSISNVIVRTRTS